MGLLSPSLLASAFRLPAPNFQKLILTGLGHATKPAEVLSADILSGGAPKLRYLELRDVYQPPEPIASYSRVDSVRLKYTDLYPNVAFAQHFPQMRRLFLEFDTHTQHPAPMSVNLAGLHLQQLAVEDSHDCDIMPAILRSIKLDEIHTMLRTRSA
ncbi:hypothetical protein AURDEDRAFT_171505 [Auricularia subglabra TFB-10046 SS5]|nr:hypothetical protein AURDEDRAFT_171505 [Auricularia subglabra TFB-10046 SS5]